MTQMGVGNYFCNNLCIFYTVLLSARDGNGTEKVSI